GNALGQGMEIPRARIIAQAFPRFADCARRRTGQTPEIRKPLQESRIVLRHSAHLRLLQHELGDEHAVRIARLAPRQIEHVAGAPRAPLRLVARWRLRTADHAGRFSFLIVDMLRGLTEWRIWVPRTLDQATAVGYGSLFIVLLVSAFAGAVTSLQTGYQFTGTLPLYYAGAVISESMILELGPVLTALILAGRIGARYAAELGTMRVTEQIDALESLGRSPVSHLLIPRVVAGLLVIPALTMFANATGIVVGYLTAKGSLGLTYGDFEYGARYFFRPLDLWYSAIKSVCFAGALTTIPCYLGFNTQQGAEGVGRATTQAVVSASVAILMLDALTTKLLLVAK